MYLRDIVILLINWKSIQLIFHFRARTYLYADVLIVSNKNHCADKYLILIMFSLSCVILFPPIVPTRIVSHYYIKVVSMYALIHVPLASLLQYNSLIFLFSY